MELPAQDVIVYTVTDANGKVVSAFLDRETADQNHDPATETVDAIVANVSRLAKDVSAKLTPVESVVLKAYNGNPFKPPKTKEQLHREEMDRLYPNQQYS